MLALLLPILFTSTIADPNFNTLNNGQTFDKVSFGLQVYDDATATKLTTIALQAGIRNFFASVLANNQKGFGAALKATTIPREEIFVCGSANTASCSNYNDCFKQTVTAW